MTSVPFSPIADRSARTTVGAPPTTQPIELNEEWTSKVIPCVTPIVARSLCRLASVLGSPENDLIFMTSMIHAGHPPPLQPVRMSKSALASACVMLSA